MKTLELVDGDLTVGPTGHGTISGARKIRQELQLALTEDYGFDRFHPTWGSTLGRYIGRVMTPETQLMVQSEIVRVLRSYIAVQQQEVLNDATAGTRSRFSTADVVNQVTAINATPVQDALQVSVSLVTQAGQEVTINQQVST